MRLLLAAALFFAATASQAAEPYICKDFAKDFQALIADMPKDIDALPTQFLRASGFMLGAFYAHSGEPFDPDSTAGMRAYEDEVLAACLKQPDRRLSLVALDVVRQPKERGKSFTVTDTRPEAQIIGGRIEYEDLLGTTRIIYQIRNATDRLIGVSVRCGLYDENGQPLGQGGGWTNGIPGKKTVVGEGMAQTSGMPAKSDCRIVTVTDQ